MFTIIARVVLNRLSSNDSLSEEWRNAALPYAAVGGLQLVYA